MSQKFLTPIDMSSNQINNVADPTSTQDAATKNYVDSHGGAPLLTTIVPTAGGTIIYDLTDTSILAVRIVMVGLSGSGTAPALQLRSGGSSLAGAVYTSLGRGESMTTTGTAATLDLAVNGGTSFHFTSNNSANDSTYGFGGEVLITNLNNAAGTVKPYVTFQVTHRTSASTTTFESMSGGGVYTSGVNATGFQILWVSGTTFNASGKVYVYGMK